MIQLLPHKDLYAIKVPFDAHSFDIDGSELYFKGSISGLKDVGMLRYLDIGSFQILGEVTKDSISFDAKPYIKNKHHVKQKLNQESRYDMFWIDIDGINNGNTKFFDSKEDAYKWSYSDSFMSLLKLHGIYFFNPKGVTPPRFAMLSLEKEYIEDCDKITKEWQQYEDNLVEKVLIIQKL